VGPVKADAAAKLDDFDAKLDRRADQRDAKLAVRQADGAEADAADAINFAAWTVDHARLAVLDAIDARADADDLTRSAGA
jgi:glycerol-3-phosphate dehydrogenase